MQEKHLYEYAVIRVVPCVEREEFLNVGVILYCSSKRFLQLLFRADENRFRCFSGEINISVIEERLQAFRTVCAGGGPIGRLPLASRFRWLTATRSTIIQTSPVHPGLCIDAEETLQVLFQQLTG